MRYKSAVDMAGFAYDHIKQVYKNCDDNNLEPVWVEKLDQFVAAVNSRDVFTLELKSKLMKDLKNLQCKSQTSQQVFHNYFASTKQEKAQEYVYDEMIQDLYNSFLDSQQIRGLLNIQNYSDLNGVSISTNITPNTMHKLANNINNYSIEELITIFYENFNVVQEASKYTHLGVSEKSLKNINRMGNLFYKGKLKQVLMIIKKIDANLKATLKNNVKEIIKERNCAGLEEDFDNVVNTDFSWTQEISNKNLYNYTLTPQYMQLYNKAYNFLKKLKRIYGVSEEEVDYCIKISIQAFVERNALNANNCARLEQLINAGYMIPAGEKVFQQYVMDLTDEDIDTILSLPKHVVDHIGRTQNAISWHNKEVVREENEKKKLDNEAFMMVVEQYASTLSPELRQLITRLEQQQKEQHIVSLNNSLVMSIKKFMEMSEVQDKNEDLVAELRKRGFDYGGRTADYRYKSLLLSPEDVKLILDMPTEILMNINKLQSALKREERLISSRIKQEEEQRILQEQKEAKEQARLEMEEAERLRKEEAQNKRIKKKEEHQQSIAYKTEGSAIWQQVDVIFKSLTSNSVNSNTTPQEVAYWFNELDMFLLDCEAIEELIKCAEHRYNVTKFREIKKNSANATNWNRVLSFLQNVKSCSIDKPIMSRIEFSVDGKLTKPTTEQENIAKEYLKQNNVPINEATYFYALRRLIIGGDINSKFDSNYLTSITDMNVK